MLATHEDERTFEVTGNPTNPAGPPLIRPRGIRINLPDIREGGIQRPWLKRVSNQREFKRELPPAARLDFPLPLEIVDLIITDGSGISALFFTEFLWFQMLQILLMALELSSSSISSLNFAHLSIRLQLNLKRFGNFCKIGKKWHHTSLAILQFHSTCSTDSKSLMQRKHNGLVSIRLLRILDWVGREFRIALQAQSFSLGTILIFQKSFQKPLDGEESEVESLSALAKLWAKWSALLTEKFPLESGPQIIKSFESLFPIGIPRIASASAAKKEL